MKKKRLLLTVFISLAFLLGCVAGQESFKMGQDLNK